MAQYFTKFIAKDADFDPEVLNSAIPVVAHFSAAWCGPCKVVAPTVDKIGGDFQGRLKCVQVEFDACPEVAKQYGVKSIPTIVVFKEGQKIGLTAGLASRETILKLVGLQDASFDWTKGPKGPLAENVTLL